MNVNVPNVDFLTLNLVDPMAASGTTGGNEPAFYYTCGGPSQTVQRITEAAAAQGVILPAAAPSVNSTWNLDFHGPSLHCNPVDTDFRRAVLDNMLNYTFARNPDAAPKDCAHGPGYVAWHPKFMTFGRLMEDNLPFTIRNLNTSFDVLNNQRTYGYPYDGIASLFFAVTPTLFNSSQGEDGSVAPTMCKGKPWYNAGLETYHDTSTVLRCDLYNSTYSTTFTFVNGIQNIDVKNVTDISNAPMTTTGQTRAYFNSSDEEDKSLQPQICPSETSEPCLPDPLVLSTLSYQAVMHTFTALVASIISLGDAEDLQTAITSTTRLSSTVLAEAPQLAFLQSMQSQSKDALPSIQERATFWEQKTFSGLVNSAAAPNSTLPFQRALEEVFQNITLSLMSAQDLQPNVSSIFYPNKTTVHSSTRENIYIYSAPKLWLAYGLAIGATAIIISFGIAAIIAKDASYSNRLSTVLQIARGAEFATEINQEDLTGRDPLPEHLTRARVRFDAVKKTAQGGGKKEYKLVDKQGKEDDEDR